METIKFYKVNTKWMKWYFVLGVVGVILGLLMFVFIDWNDDTHWLDISSPILLTGQSIMFLILSIQQIRWSKSYFSWDDERIEFLLPKSKESKSIQISEIKDIQIYPKVISFKTSNDELSINFDNVQFHELRIIKEKFEEIKAKLIA